MKTVLLFVLGIFVYFVLAFFINSLRKRMFPERTEESLAVKQSVMTIAVLMTAFSLASVIFLHLPFLAMPGVYIGLILSMLLGGEHHGPGDPYSWSLFAAPVNFCLYYALVKAVARRFPAFF